MEHIIRYLAAMEWSALEAHWLVLLSEFLRFLHFAHAVVLLVELSLHCRVQSHSIDVMTFWTKQEIGLWVVVHLLEQTPGVRIIMKHDYLA